MQFRRIAGPPRYNRVAQGPVRYVRVAADNGVVIGYVWANDEDEAAGWVTPPELGAAEINAGAAWLRKLRDAKAREIAPTALLAELIRDTSDIQGSRVVPGSPAESTTLDGLKELANKGCPPPREVTEHGRMTEVRRPNPRLNEDLLFNAAPGGPPRYSHLSDKPVQYLTVANRDGEVIGYAWANDEDDAAGWAVRKAGGDQAFNDGSVWAIKLHERRPGAFCLPPPWQR
ncbi:hypothetical protein OIE61_22555 [Streptomyces sp. NBC_01762]|uniref:hypothetical protein n=1 Tax=unclassified Streptomyces TaxID=2593676 RepID=UPI002DD99398|nr:MULTISPECIES: hypothetical protein [unclassified Streptomyces]WSC46505.1 hypothetical protein OIE61_22555 [Streptomyces sp. NBC_01762]WSD26157.1 hypothetical protein OHA26_23245 [Streptomyces sp. NBC_01751]